MKRFAQTANHLKHEWFPKRHSTCARTNYEVKCMPLPRVIQGVLTRGPSAATCCSGTHSL